MDKRLSAMTATVQKDTIPTFQQIFSDNLKMYTVKKRLKRFHHNLCSFVNVTPKSLIVDVRQKQWLQNIISV